MAPTATKTSKKRSAPAQAGRKPKKVQLEKTEPEESAKGKKRSRPITLPAAPAEESEASSDEDDDGGEVDEGGFGEDDGVVDIVFQSTEYTT